jgi:hypothetical protein
VARQEGIVTAAAQLIGRACVALAIAACHSHADRPMTAVGSATPVYRFTNGLWYDGHAFRAETVYSVYGHLTRRPVTNVDAVIDLHGGYVVPPFGEAHNHNGGMPNDATTPTRYLQAGIFYVKNPDNAPQWPALSRGHVNTPASIDVAFANGGFTSPGGHPAGLIRRNIERGIMTEADGEGAFYFSVASRADVDRAWPAYEAQHSDFTKLYLLFSEDYAKRQADATYFARRGLDPALVRYIVSRAHASKKPVTAHVETAADFRSAIDAGVDEIAHLPGFRPDGDQLSAYGDLARYRLTADDARAAARHHVVVVTTVSELLEMLDAAPPQDAKLARAIRTLIEDNLRVLHAEGVRIAVGSDRFRNADTREIDALARLGIFDNATLLRMWSVDTPHTIFPLRHVGSLDTGAEASLLVLDGNPLVDFSATKRIRVRVKQGNLLP